MAHTCEANENKCKNRENGKYLSLLLCHQRYSRPQNHFISAQLHEHTRHQYRPISSSGDATNTPNSAPQPYVHSTPPAPAVGFSSALSAPFVSIFQINWSCWHFFRFTFSTHIEFAAATVFFYFLVSLNAFFSLFYCALLSSPRLYTARADDWHQTHACSRRQQRHWCFEALWLGKLSKHRRRNKKESCRKTKIITQRNIKWKRISMNDKEK